MRSIYIFIIYNFEVECFEYGVIYINDFDIWCINYFKIILNKKVRKMVYIYFRLFYVKYIIIFCEFYDKYIYRRKRKRY